MAERILRELQRGELIEALVPRDRLLQETEELLLEELTVEDRLNEEVREILKKYEKEIERGRLDYRKLFEMTKQKLVRERNIVL
jgi:hypothetical protein